MITVSDAKLYHKTEESMESHYNCCESSNWFQFIVFTNQNQTKFFSISNFTVIFHSLKLFWVYCWEQRVHQNFPIFQYCKCFRIKFYQWCMSIIPFSISKNNRPTNYDCIISLLRNHALKSLFLQQLHQLWLCSKLLLLVSAITFLWFHTMVLFNRNWFIGLFFKVPVNFVFIFLFNDT